MYLEYSNIRVFVEWSHESLCSIKEISYERAECFLLRTPFHMIWLLWCSWSSRDAVVQAEHNTQRSGCNCHIVCVFKAAEESYSLQCLTTTHGVTYRLCLPSVLILKHSALVKHNLKIHKNVREQSLYKTVWVCNELIEYRVSAN